MHCREYICPLPPRLHLPTPRSPPYVFRAVLVALATGVERSQDGAASAAMHGHAGEFLRWLQGCAATGSDSGTRELAGAVLRHASVQALAMF